MESKNFTNSNSRTGILVYGDNILDFDNLTVNSVHISLFMSSDSCIYEEDEELYDLYWKMYLIFNPNATRKKEEEEEEIESVVSSIYTPKCIITQEWLDKCVFPEPITALELNVLLGSENYDGDYDTLLEEYENSKEEE